MLAERVSAAAALWRAGGGRLILAAGGITGGRHARRGDVIAAALRDLGVPGVLTERASRSTFDNARIVAARCSRPTAFARSGS